MRDVVVGPCASSAAHRHRQSASQYVAQFQFADLPPSAFRHQRPAVIRVPDLVDSYADVAAAEKPTIAAKSTTCDGSSKSFPFEKSGEAFTASLGFSGCV